MTEVSRDLWVMSHEHEQEQTYIQNYICIDILLYIQRIPDLTVKLLHVE